MKIFLDTNIIMDFLVREGRPNYVASSRILYEATGNPEVATYCSVQSITDCAYYFTKKGVTDVHLFIERIKNLLTFIRVKSPSEQLVYETLTHAFPDFEDEMLLRCAIENDCAYFITGDQRILDNQPFPSLIKSIHPADFLAKAAKQ